MALVGAPPSTAQYQAIGCPNQRKTASFDAQGTLEFLQIVEQERQGDQLIPVPNLTPLALKTLSYYVDTIYGPTVGGSGTPSVSGTSIFSSLLTTDIQFLNAQESCDPTSSGLGLLNGYTDANGIFFCNGSNGQGTALQTPYTGLTNSQILQTAWPAIFTSNSQIFSEEFVSAIGGGDNGTTISVDQNFNPPSFTSTQLEVHGLITNGQQPTTEQFASSGYGVVPYTPKAGCKSPYTNPPTTYPGNGHIFTCETVATNLPFYTVGQISTLSPYLINRFNSLGVDIFVFDSLAAFNNYTDLAGGIAIPELDPSITGFVVPQGSPNHPSPFIVLYSSPTMYYLDKVINIELGRMFDVVTGTSKSSAFQAMVDQDLADFSAQPLIPYRSSLPYPAACSSETNNRNLTLCSMGPSEGSSKAVDYAFFVAFEFADQLGNGTPYEWSEVEVSGFKKGGTLTPTNTVRSIDYIKSISSGGVNR